MGRPRLSAVSKCLCVITEMREVLPELVFRNVQASQFAYHIFVLPVGLGVPKGENKVMFGCKSQRTAEPASRSVCVAAEPWVTGRAGHKIPWMVCPLAPEGELGVRGGFLVLWLKGNLSASFR